MFENSFFRPWKDSPDRDLMNRTDRSPKVSHRLKKILPQHFLFTTGNKMLPLFNIEDDCDLNNDDDNYLILSPYYLLDSVLMLLHVILFLEIPRPSGIYLWQFSLVKNFLSLLYRACSATVIS